MNRRHLLQFGFLALAAPLRLLAEETIEVGFDYRRLTTPLTVEVNDRPEVLEIFWYGCPHCQQLQAPLEEWRRRHDHAIRFRRLPAVLNERWAVHARTFYAAEAMGVAERIHIPLFDAIHHHRRPLYDEGSLAAFMGEQGVDPVRFRELFHAFGIEARVRQAEGIAKSLKLDGVPALLVGGEYLTSPEMTGSRERTLRVLDHLLGLAAVRQHNL